MKNYLSGTRIVVLILMTGACAFAQSSIIDIINPKPKPTTPRPPLSRKSDKSKNWLIEPVDVSAIIDLYGNANPDGRQPPNPLLGLKMLSNNGPDFEVRKPTARSVKSPVEIDIRFIAQDDPVDLQTLRIDAQMYLAGAFRGHIDLVPRLRPYATPSGIVTTPMWIPSGTYRLQISLKDKRGGESSAELVITVR